MSKPPEHCRICGRTASPGMPLGEGPFYQCSHVDCPHRGGVTAQPRDKVPPPAPKE